MGVVWVVDQPNNSLPEYLLALMGNFPCRVVGSVTSVGKLLKLNSFAKPNLLLVNMSSISHSPRYVREVLQCDLPATPIALVYPELPDTDDILSWQIDTPTGEVVARVRRLLKASVAFHKAKIFMDSYVLDLDNMTFGDSSRGFSEAVTPKEAKILGLFMGQKGKNVSKDMIKDRAWPDTVVSPRTIDSHISRLRKRLATVGLTIENIYGGGYILK